MGSNTNITLKGKKTAKPATFGGAMISGVFNAGLGIVIAFCVLAGTAPQTYTPATNVKPGQPPPAPPAGIWYWAGSERGGDWKGKEAAYLAGMPVTLAEGELNAWSHATFKAVPGAAKPAAPAGAKGAAAGSGDMFNLVPGSPNFRAYKPADVADGYFQVAIPFTVSLLGFDVPVVYQARGHFVSGPNGPRFEPFYTSLGSAKIPATGGAAAFIFNRLLTAFTTGEGPKKYVEAWAKYGAATPQDGALVLAAK